MTTDTLTIQSIIDQHAEEASFVCQQRIEAALSPGFTLVDLMRLDERIAAHLDGLRIAGEAGWDACESLVSDQDSGALFAAALLALEARDRRAFSSLQKVVKRVPEMRPALVFAFAWGPTEALRDIAKEMLTSTSAFSCRMGINCCVAHGLDPQHHLDALIRDPDPLLKARALFAVGELGRSDLRSACEQNLWDHDSACRFSAAWAAVLLGNRGEALNVLQDFGHSQGPYHKRALHLALQAGTAKVGRTLLKALSQDQALLRSAIQGAGILGDPSYVPWLIKLMEEAPTARLAAEAFSLVVGVDLVQSDLEGKQPDGFEAGPNDDPEDTNVEMDPDEALPWPDPLKVQTWWDANNNRFRGGTRYFVGAPVTREHCIQVLKNGHQPQRILAARYLRLLDPGRPLFDTSAPAWRQQRILEQME
ncbi:TIGR02270 family protein [Microvirga sp. 0TCS3.31]